MAKTVKKTNGFPIRYKKYVSASVNDNTKSTIQHRKNAHEIITNHILTYDNVNQTILGSFIYRLLNTSVTNPERYKNERLVILKEMYDYVTSNHAWYDLWQTAKMIEEKLYTQKSVIDHQVASEIVDMLRLHLPYPKFIVGLNDDHSPILQTPPFYVTEKLLNYIEYSKSAGRKKGKELFTIQTQTVEFATYLVHSFGLYREVHLDLLAQNGLTNDTVLNIKLPRKLVDSSKMTDFVIKNRQYTMNPHGVVIDCYNCGDVEQVILLEQEGFLLWKVIFKQKGVTLNQKGDLVQDGKGGEYCGYFSPNFFPRSTFSEHSTFIHFEFDLYDFILECYADVVCGSTLLNKAFNREVLNMGMLEMQGHEKNNTKMGMRFIPRNIHRTAKEKTPQKYEEELKKYFIAGHIRKLPEGHTPSKEAIAHAQEFGIDLPEQYTFVRPYETGDEKLRSHYIKRV